MIVLDKIWLALAVSQLAILSKLIEEALTKHRQVAKVGPVITFAIAATGRETRGAAVHGAGRDDSIGAVGIFGARGAERLVQVEGLLVEAFLAIAAGTRLLWRR